MDDWVGMFVIAVVGLGGMTALLLVVWLLMRQRESSTTVLREHSNALLEMVAEDRERQRKHVERMSDPRLAQIQAHADLAALAAPRAHAPGAPEPETSQLGEPPI